MNICSENLPKVYKVPANSTPGEVAILMSYSRSETRQRNLRSLLRIRRIVISAAHLFEKAGLKLLSEKHQSHCQYLSGMEENVKVKYKFPYFTITA